MNAIEARQLTDSTKKDIHYLFESIKAMAESSKDYATFESCRIKDLPNCIETLKNLGYKLEQTEKYLTVIW